MCLIWSKSTKLNIMNTPKDVCFTPVCTTEFIAFSKSNMYFQNLNTQLIGLSIDSNPSHLAWLNDIMLRTGIEVPFPVIADRNGEIARKYGMIASDVSTTETVRNVFIIDDKGIVRTIFIYPLNVGRWIPEIIRVVEALQIADCNKASTPANWIPGQPIIKPAPTTFKGLQERQKEVQTNRNGISWYLNFKETEENCNKKIEPNNKLLNEKDKKC